MYCIDFLDQNFSWLADKILLHQDEFLIFDLPGQLELFLNSDSLKSVISKLQKELGDRRLKATVVELFDSHYIQDLNKFLSACTYSLVSMINLELPHINVLSKIDLLENSAKLDFRMEYYTECSTFDPLASKLDKNSTAFNKKYSPLSKKICELLDNYGLTSFTPLDVMDKVSVSNLLFKIDKCNGYVIDQKEEESADIREIIYKTGQPSETLSKFERKVEQEEEDQMKQELRIWERLAKGEIDEDEADQLMAALR